MVSASIEQQVRDRARGLCEYCRFPEAVHAYPFHVEHIISRQHNGTTTLENLALACNLCNLHKGPNIAGIDPVTGNLVRLFDPRKDEWPEHFVREGPHVRGLTPTGRVTVHLLNMNDPQRVEVRRVCIAAGLLSS